MYDLGVHMIMCHPNWMISFVDMEVAQNTAGNTATRNLQTATCNLHPP